KPGGVILVDHGFHTFQLAIAVADNRNASAASANDRNARFDQKPDDTDLDDPARRGRGYDAAPVALALLAHGPFLLVAQPVRFQLVIKRADQLAWPLEGGIVAIDLDLGQKRGAASAERHGVDHFLLDQIAD